MHLGLVVWFVLVQYNFMLYDVQTKHPFRGNPIKNEDYENLYDQYEKCKRFMVRIRNLEVDYDIAENFVGEYQKWDSLNNNLL